MHVGELRVVFDTSAINWLLDDPAKESIIERLEGWFRVGISQNSVEEIGGTASSERRKDLINLCRRLLPISDCLLPHQSIIEEMARCDTRYGERFDWRDVDISSRSTAKELGKREFLMSDEIAAESRKWTRLQNGRYLGIFRKSRDAVRPDSRDDLGYLKREEVMQICKGEGGELWKHAAGLYELARFIRLDEREAGAFLARCPPLRAMCLGTMIAYYYHGIPKVKKFGAGFIDFSMAIYLPYCKFFVSSDRDQCEALSVIAEESGLETKVLYYDAFLKTLTEGLECSPQSLPTADDDGIPA